MGPASPGIGPVSLRFVLLLYLVVLLFSGFASVLLRFLFILLGFFLFFFFSFSSYVRVRFALPFAIRVALRRFCFELKRKPLRIAFAVAQRKQRANAHGGRGGGAPCCPLTDQISEFIIFLIS